MYNRTKQAKIENDPTKHYPNKNEATVLRKIKSETGLNEDEIREIKKYRIMLADASKSGEKSLTSATEKFYKDCIKDACRETGLVPQHPKTLEALQRILSRTPRRWFMWGDIKKAETVVKHYAK